MNVREWRLQFGTVGDNDVFVPVEGLFADAAVGAVAVVIAIHIYGLFTAAMIDPLPPMQQEFLTVLGLADEFTIGMAESVTGRADAAVLLAELTASGRSAS